MFVAAGEQFFPVFFLVGTKYVPVCFLEFWWDRCIREEEEEEEDGSPVSDKFKSLYKWCITC